MWEKIETYIVITVIAALTWLYAEGENVKLYDNVHAEVHFIAPTGEDMLIQPSGNFPVKMTIRTSASQFTQLKRELDETGPLALTVEDTQGAERVESLRDRLSAMLGVNIESIDPPSVSVRAERKVELTLPVEIITGDLHLAGSPTSDMVEAMVRVPAGRVELLKGVALEARLNAITNVQSLDPGTYEESVRLRLPEQVSPIAGLEIVPTNVSVRFTIEKRTGSVRLPIVRVAVVALPSILERFDIDLPPENRILRDVALRGPADAIARIENDPSQVYAVLEFFQSDDMRLGTDRKLPELRLPPNVTLDSSIERVEYTVTRRQTPPITPPVPAPVVPEPTAPAPLAP